MEIILLIIYSTIVWFIFFKKKWLPWNITSQVIVVTIPVICLACIILFMNIVAPSSSDVRAQNYVIPIVPRVCRVVRAAALSVRVMPYVDAARAAGYSDSRIIFRHMAPNVVAPYLIMLTAFIAQAILAEASLSFLGLGVTEPTAA